MKKLMYLSLVGVMGLLMSCGGNGESQGPADKEPVIYDKAVDTTVVVAEPVETTTESAE